jgi:hypothetical protein
MKVRYGKITNTSAKYNGINRIGDYGSDKEGFSFVYTVSGWKVCNQPVYEANYWKKKYEKLKAKTK